LPRQVANRVIFMDQGQIVEQNSPKEFFNNPQSDRTKLFLSQILGHCQSPVTPAQAGATISKRSPLSRG
jgi:ABC-type methionine transport system ATPase subunit